MIFNNNFYICTSLHFSYLTSNNSYKSVTFYTFYSPYRTEAFLRFSFYYCILFSIVHSHEKNKLKRLFGKRYFPLHVSGARDKTNDFTIGFTQCTVIK